MPVSCVLSLERDVQALAGAWRWTPTKKQTCWMKERKAQKLLQSGKWMETELVEQDM